MVRRRRVAVKTSNVVRKRISKIFGEAYIRVPSGRRFSPLPSPGGVLPTPTTPAPPAPADTYSTVAGSLHQRSAHPPSRVQAHAISRPSPQERPGHLCSTISTPPMPTHRRAARRAHGHPRADTAVLSVRASPGPQFSSRSAIASRSASARFSFPLYSRMPARSS